MAYSSVVQLQASGPYMAHQSVISGPRMDSGKIFKSEIYWNAFEVYVKNMLKHLSHWIACAGWSAFAQEQWIIPFLCTIIVFVLFIYLTIKLEGRPSPNSPLKLLTGLSLSFSLSRLSLSWRVHLAQWTKYRQINLSIYPLNGPSQSGPLAKLIADPGN